MRKNELGRRMTRWMEERIIQQGRRGAVIRNGRGLCGLLQATQSLCMHEKKSLFDSMECQGATDLPPPLCQIVAPALPCVHMIKQQQQQCSYLFSQSQDDQEGKHSAATVCGATKCLVEAITCEQNRTRMAW